MNASSGIRTHDPSVWIRGDISHIRPRGYCDTQTINIYRYEFCIAKKPDAQIRKAKQEQELV
jgi:hypothetical protein